MKKKIVAILTLVSIAGASVAGCGNGSGSKEISNEYIKISQYKNLEVAEIEKSEVTDEEVEAQIEAVLEQNSTSVDITDRAVEEGDTAIIDYTGYKGEEAFEGGTATDSPLVIGSGTFIDGFEDAIIGRNIDDNFDIDLTFPEEYQSEDLAGQDVVFNVTVKGIQQSEVPELDEEFVQTLSDTATTVDEYKKEVKENLQTQYDKNAEETLQNACWDVLMDNTEVVKLPEDRVEEVVTELTTQYKDMAGYYNVEFDEFVTTYMNMTKEDFDEQIQSSSELSVKRELAIELIAEKEKLEPSEEEYQEKYQELADEYGYEDVDVLLEAAGEDTLKQKVLQDIVGEWLVENCKQVAESELQDTSDDGSKDDNSEE